MYIYQKGEGWDRFNSLAVPYFCVFPKPDLHPHLSLCYIDL